MYNMSPAPQLGTDNVGNRCDSTVYLTVRRRQPSETSPIRSSVQGVSDFRQENYTNVGWERCTVFDGENGKDEGDEQAVEGKKEEGDDQVIDEYTRKQLSKTRSSLTVERPSVDDKRFTSTTTVGGSEIDLKEMITQQKRRILINTSNYRPCHASPERCRASKAEPKSSQQDYEGPGTHASGLPRSRNLIADHGSAVTYWSPSRATVEDSQTAGQRNDGSDEKSSLQNSKINGNERMFLPLFLSCGV